jgi:hypothetical protein
MVKRRITPKSHYKDSPTERVVVFLIKAIWVVGITSIVGFLMGSV